MRRNIYGTDDWMIRCGYLLLATTILAPSCSADASLNAIFMSPWTWVGSGVSAVILAIGYGVRADEKRIIGVWHILEHATEVRIEELAVSSGRTVRFLRRAVQIINQQPNVYYVWDEQHGVIVDGRLRTRRHAVDRCESCGAAVAVTFSLDVPAIPRCEYCGGPVMVRDLNQLKEDHMKQLRAESGAVQRRFNLWVFLLLFFFTGGIAAIPYALWATGVFHHLCKELGLSKTCKT
ncbi:MAG: hypothetical protein GKR94_08370 [Gammaproteobacteria bacterium]|nr:hypothetical protein [Gammaproteobacteria bacterium]